MLTKIAGQVASEVRALGVVARFFALYGLRNAATHAEFQLLTTQSEQRLLAEFTPERIKTDPILAGYRRLHEAVGCSNKRNIAAPESLLLFLLRTGALPQINLIVDIYNLISAQTRLSLGAHDIRQVSGAVQLRLTDGSERFLPLGAEEPKLVRAGEYAYIDDARDILCRLEVRQAEKSKITLETTDAFFIVQGNAATNDAYLDAATSELIALLQRFCGGTVELL